MKTIKCLIVDDEPIARDIIASHLSKVNHWHIVKSCMNAEEAYTTLLHEDIDVVFLDIEMPETTGIEFLQSLQNPPLVIFTTAYSAYAMKGYELNVVDYLLKPISLPRFFQAIEKTQKMLDLLDKTPPSDSPARSFIFIKHKGKLQKVEFSDISYIKAEQEYSLIVTSKAKLLASRHLKLLLTELPHEQFTRIHRSYVVAHQKISTISGNQVVLEGGIKLSIGSTYKEALLAKLKI